MQTSLTRRALVRRGTASGLALAAPAALGLKLAPARGASPPCPVTAAPARCVAAVVAAGAVWACDDSTRRLHAFDPRTGMATGQTVDVGGAPVAIVAGRRVAAVATAAVDRPGLAFVDLAAGRLLGRVELEDRDPRAVVLRRGVAWVVADGAAPALVPVALDGAHAQAPIALGAHPRGIARAGALAYVALQGASALQGVDLDARRALDPIAVPPLPTDLAIARDGSRAYVLHERPRSRAVTVVDLGTGRVHGPWQAGLEPGALAVTPRGTVVCADTGADTLTFLDGRSGRRVRTARVRPRPRSLALARGRVYVLSEREAVAEAVAL